MYPKGSDVGLKILLLTSTKCEKADKWLLNPPEPVRPVTIWAEPQRDTDAMLNERGSFKGRTTLIKGSYAITYWPELSNQNQPPWKEVSQGFLQ